VTHTTLELADTTALVIGTPYDGRSNGTYTAWTLTNEHHCQDPIVVALEDGRVLVAAGFEAYAVMTHDCPSHIYDPEADAWSPAELPDGLGRAGTGTRLADGRVLIIAGRTIIIDPPPR
jgi:hypothetical protein